VSDPQKLAGCREAEGSGYDFPTYLIAGRPSFSPVSISGKPRVLVVSIPKSGTYLIAAFLKELGLIDTGVHLTDDGFTDYRNKSIPDMIAKYREFRKLYPLSQALDLICEGQFAVGHLKCAAQTVAATSGFTILFTQRELRSALVSMMRFMCRPGRGEDWLWKEFRDPRLRLLGFLRERGSEVMAWFESIIRWSSQPGVLNVQFEELIEGNQDLARLVSKKVDTEEPESQAGKALMRVLGQPTMTWSGRISDTQAYWSEQAELLFQELGGPKLNRRLGYQADHVDFAPLTVLPVLDDGFRLMGQLRDAMTELQTKLRREQELNKRTTEELTGFSWPNLCRVAARAIEHCRERGYKSVALYGAGNHTSKLLPIWEGLGGPSIASLFESDQLVGPRFGHPIRAVSGTVPPEIQAVVPSSHAFETTMRRSWLSRHPEIPWVPLWEPDETAPTISESDG